ncbi:hypothetical protein QVD99_004987 [Batrachochytrium dendrobatidis]|nr:hypothetical protein QVD99_004987 [Batrachochytrium dendrobatidis]
MVSFGNSGSDLAGGKQASLKSTFIAKLKGFRGKSKEITQLLDEATDESLTRVDWVKTRQAAAIACTSSSGPDTVVKALLESLEKGPVQQTYVLHVMYWMLENQQPSFYARFYDSSNLDRLFEIWTSKGFAPESKALLAAIVDQMPSSGSPAYERNLHLLRSRASEKGLLGGYDLELIFFDTPETGLISLADQQTCRMLQASRTSSQMTMHSGQNHQLGQTSFVSQQPQVVIMDYNAHAQIVLSNASMLTEAVNFSDENEPLVSNQIVQEFRTNCINLRQTTNQFLQQGVLTEVAINALINCNNKLTEAFRVYDEALEGQMIQSAIDKSRTGKEATPLITFEETDREAQEAEQLRIALEQSRVDGLRSVNPFWEKEDEHVGVSEIGGHSKTSSSLTLGADAAPYIIGGGSHGSTTASGSGSTSLLTFTDAPNSNSGKNVTFSKSVHG